jgi:hydroxypyruvate isomerase
MIKVDLNISLLLKEYPFLERFDEAAKLGFAAVEFYWSSEVDPSEIAQKVVDSGLKVAAFNFDVGNMAGGDRGLLNDPERQTQMRENVAVALELAGKIGCHKMTQLTGNLRPGEDRRKQLDYIRENLHWVCEQAAKAGVTVMVEAINGWDNRFYPLTNTRETIAFLDSVNAPNLKYLFDMYHMQRMEGNLTATLEQFVDKIAHIQIADSPKRNQPGTGEINFNYVLKVIDESRYEGSVGLEYNPLGSTAESLDWLPKEHRQGITLESFRL